MAAFVVQAATDRRQFDKAYRRLRQGRTYTAQPTGLVRMSNRSNGVEHHFVLNVPDTYDPREEISGPHSSCTAAWRYVATISRWGPARSARSPASSRFTSIPYAWAGAPWWSDDQVLTTFDAILDAVKRRYNVDENRVVVSGVSDGGTGAYYVAMRDTTPFASFLPLNGYWMVLASRDIDDGDALRATTSATSRSSSSTADAIRCIRRASSIRTSSTTRRAASSLDYHPQPDAGHNTQWWPTVRDSFEAFVRAHPRQPLPDTLTWETSDSSKHNRAHWLVIDELGSVKDEAKSLPDLNEMAMAAGAGFRRALERHAHQPGDARLERRQDRPEGRRRARAVERSDGRAAPTFRTRSRTSSPARTSICSSRATTCRWRLSGIYEPAIVTGPPRHAVRAGRTLGPRRPDARRQRRPGHDARRHRVHAAAVAGSVRLREAGEGRRQRPNGVRRPRAERRPDAARSGPPSTTIGRCCSAAEVHVELTR